MQISHRQGVLSGSVNGFNAPNFLSFTGSAVDIFNGPVNAKAIISAEARKSPYILTPEQIAEKAIMHDNAFLATVHDQWIRRYTEIFSS